MSFQGIDKTRWKAHSCLEGRVCCPGFRYDADYKSRRTISIKAHRFSIHKKKLGFFRFGLMNQARLENDVINIYLF